MYEKTPVGIFPERSVVAATASRGQNAVGPRSFIAGGALRLLASLWRRWLSPSVGVILWVLPWSAAQEKQLCAGQWSSTCQGIHCGFVLPSLSRHGVAAVALGTPGSCSTVTAAPIQGQEHFLRSYFKQSQ